jgi:diguanylate cyclase (GGDEF)-like protein
MLFMASVIAVKRRAERIIYNSAYVDPTTDLANKRSLSEKLSIIFNISQRNAQSFAILFIDLDKFKSVNDIYGHDVGDALLKGVGLRLASCVRNEDVVSRFGGDEFVVLLSELYTSHDVKIVAEKIIRAMSAPFSIQRHAICSSVSIGIAVYPDHGNTTEILMQNADSALYAVKQSGRNGYKVSEEA